MENGFYYDCELPHRITPEDFEKIEAEMKKEIKANNVFERTVVSRLSRSRDRLFLGRRLTARAGSES